jgi:hypothetical protein
MPNTISLAACAPVPAAPATIPTLARKAKHRIGIFAFHGENFRLPAEQTVAISLILQPIDTRGTPESGPAAM